MSVLVVGSVAYDGLITPFGQVDKTLGGSASYISLATSYFTEHVNLVGVVGKDFEESDVDIFRNHHIDLEGLQRDSSGKTFYWKGEYHYDLNTRDTLDTQLNVFEHFEPIIPAGYRDSEFIALGNIQPKLQTQVLEQVNEPKFVVMDTMNFWIEGTPDELQKTLERVNMLVINDSEARELADEPNLIKAADNIRDMGPEHLIIKKGEHGAMLFTDGERFSAPAYPVIDLFDPTGAGDTFLGGLIGWLAYTDDLSALNMRKGVIFGTVMASLCVEKFGTERLVELDESIIYDRYREIRKLSHIPEYDG